MKTLFKIQLLFLVSLSFASSGKVDYYLCFEKSGTIDLHLKDCHDENPSTDLHIDDHQEVENCSDQLLGGHEQLSSLVFTKQIHSHNLFLITHPVLFASILPSRTPPSFFPQITIYGKTSQQKAIKTTVLLL